MIFEKPKNVLRKRTVFFDSPQMCRKDICLFLTLVSLLIPQVLLAQNAFGGGIAKIARHDKREGGVKFFEAFDKSETSGWGLLFRRDLFEKQPSSDDALLHYEELPKCKKSEVELEEVFQDSAGSEGLDVLYYTPTDLEQAQKASSYPRAIAAYQPALVKDPQTGKADPVQEFARIIQVKCLPTRFHFVYLGSKRYIEIRTGDRAWD